MGDSMLKNKFKVNIRRVFKAFNKMEMRVLPGNVAFFFILAIIPLINMILFWVTKFSISVDTVMRLLSRFFPLDVSRTIVNALSTDSFEGRIGLFSFVVLLVASNGTYAIINAANTLYKVPKNDVIKNRVKSFVLLTILLSLIMFVLLVPILGEKIILMINNKYLYNNAFILYKIIKWPLSFFLIYVGLKLIYTISPSMKINSSSTTYGALFTTAIWIIATVLFSYYLSNFADYSVVYGNLSSIIILVIWLYIISYVFVMGIAINSVYYYEINNKDL